jgi:hypothetical protein
MSDHVRWQGLQEMVFHETLLEGFLKLPLLETPGGALYSVPLNFPEDKVFPFLKKSFKPYLQ